MREIVLCRKCGKPLKIFPKNKKCVNLICINYNVSIRRRNNANKQKRYEKTIQHEEE